MKKGWNEPFRASSEDMEASNSCSGQDILANRSSDRCTENFNLYTSNRIDGTGIVHHTSIFANGSSQLLYPVGILSLIVLNIRLVEISYKSPYKRLNSLPKPSEKPCWHHPDICRRKTVRPESSSRDKNSIQTATYLKGGTLREKKLAQALMEFFAPIENQRYILRAKNLWVNDQTKYALLFWSIPR